MANYKTTGFKSRKSIIVIEEAGTGNITCAYYNNEETGELITMTAEEIEEELF